MIDLSAVSNDERLAGYVYERGVGRYKHRWNRDEAGFGPGKNGQVGKCHCSITLEVATRLLRNCVVEPVPYALGGDDEEGEDDAPRRVYNIYRGVPYVAVPSRPGASYHGYPWRGRMSATVRQTLEQRARDEGTLREFRKWLKAYGEG